MMQAFVDHFELPNSSSIRLKLGGVALIGPDRPNVRRGHFCITLAMPWYRLIESELRMQRNVSLNVG
jgi:hypothetical protein